MRRDNQDESEFEIQAEAYNNLRKHFTWLDVRGEYHYRNKEGKRAARFDIAILRKNDLLAIVEVKRRNRKRSWAQAERYGSLTGKPVIYIRGINQAREAVSIVIEYMATAHLLADFLKGT